MPKLVWDEIGEHIYEIGVSNGVLYPVVSGAYSTGVVWNGLTAVTESPSGAEFTPLYADNIKYLNLQAVEEFGATVEAYTYPDEFAECDGSAYLKPGVSIGQQPRKTFGMSYRTEVGNDVSGSDLGYKLHLIYGAMAKPSQKGYKTINNSPEAITFSWEVQTTPVNVSGHKATASLVIDSTKVDAAELATLEAVLYGVDAEAFDASSTYAVGDYVTYQNKTYRCKTAISTAAAWDSSKWDEVTETPGPRLPLPDEVATFFSAN